jgi:23S rRNA (cytidine1920-2'-O)/16S rRNA (cytidine1409-2'-O)-methyltransferase
LEAEYISEDVSLITCDVSFIPLRIALPAALNLIKTGAHLIALIKPQFEVGKDGVGKGGIVKDKNAYERVNQEVSDFLVSSGWSVQGLIPSPMEGGDGNLEFLIAAQKTTAES